MGRIIPSDQWFRWPGMHFIPITDSDKFPARMRLPSKSYDTHAAYIAEWNKFSDWNFSNAPLKDTANSTLYNNPDARVRLITRIGMAARKANR